MSQTSLGTAEKTAAERLRLPVDFGDVAQLVAGASGGAPDPLVLAVNIVSQNVTCTGTGAPTVTGIQLDFPYQISALFSGGTPTTGNSPGYPVTYSITLDDADGTVVQRTGYLKVNA